MPVEEPPAPPPSATSIRRLHPPPPSAASAADDATISRVAEYFLSGKVVPFLGAGVNLNGIRSTNLLSPALD